MIILSWNIRGLGARVKKSLLRKLIRTHEPFLVFIQESNTENCTQKLINSFWNDPKISWAASPSTGLSGGIISLWNNSHFSSKEVKIQKNWVALKGFIKNNTWECTLINIYGPCNVEGRKEVWMDIINFVNNESIPILIMGDFNETISPQDRGSKWINTQGSAEFIEFINILGLLEIPASNGTFTWFHGQSRSKLDRLLLSTEWLTLFPDFKVSLLNRTLSDHKPLLASSFEQDWGPRPFKSINCWFSHSGCLPTIRKSWSDSKNLAPHDRLKKLRSDLCKWNIDEFGHIDTIISDLESKIADLDNKAEVQQLDESEILERKNHQVNLWRWLKNKESLWAQKSRIQWLKEGDKNTCFFMQLHQFEKGKTISLLYYQKKLTLFPLQM